MGETLTIRLDRGDRETLTRAAGERGIGLSAFVRDLAEAEAKRVRRAAIRTDGERVVAYLAHHPEAKAELETYGTPIDDLPWERSRG